MNLDKNEIKTGQQWKKNDGTVVTITRVSDVGVTYTGRFHFNRKTEEWEEARGGCNFAQFRGNFTLLD